MTEQWRGEQGPDEPMALAEKILRLVRAQTSNVVVQSAALSIAQMILTTVISEA